MSMCRILRTAGSPAGAAEAPARYGVGRGLVELDARRRKHDALRQTLTASHHDSGGTDVQHLNFHLVCRAPVIRVDDPHTVGDDEAPLIRGAAAGDDREEVALRHPDDQARTDE